MSDRPTSVTRSGLPIRQESTTDTSPLTSLEGTEGETTEERPPVPPGFDAELAAMLEEERSLQEHLAQRMEPQPSELTATREQVSQLQQAIEGVPTPAGSAATTPMPVAEGHKTLVNPDPYKGKTHREFLDFMYKCEVNFRRDRHQFDTEESKVLYTLSLCEGTPMGRWREHEATLEGNPSWQEFKTFMENLITHPENQHLNMERKWKAATQKENQTVQDFILYLETIAPYLEDMSDKWKATQLLLGLQPPIANTIIARADPPTSYEPLQHLAERIEATQRWNIRESRNQWPSDNNPNRIPRGTRRGRDTGRGFDRQQRSNTSPGGTPKQQRGEDRPNDTWDLSNALGDLEKEQKQLQITVEASTPEGGRRQLNALVDSGASINCISPLLAKEMRWTLTNLLPHYVEGINRHPLHTIDSEEYPLILGFPWLEAANPLISFCHKEWRYPEENKDLLAQIVDLHLKDNGDKMDPKLPLEGRGTQAFWRHQLSPKDIAIVKPSQVRRLVKENQS
ncbi:hypothetical protein DV735_g319, partial [Chaetothyriales sp. CBS 134920]